MNDLIFISAALSGLAIGISVFNLVYKCQFMKLNKKAQYWADLLKSEIDSQTCVPFTDQEINECKTSGHIFNTRKNIDELIKFLEE